jgi:transposase
MKGYVSIQEHEALQAKYASIKFQLEQLQRLVYGQKSERFISDVSPEQLSLFEKLKKIETALQTTKVAEHERKEKKQPRLGRLQLPSHLKKEIVVLEPEADTTGMQKLGSETTKILVYQPAELRVKVILRPKYIKPISPSSKVDLSEIEQAITASQQDATSLQDNQYLTEELRNPKILIAPLPSRFIDKCIADETLLTAIIIAKYVDHLPLYRQQQQFKRLGITIPRSTLSNWIAQSAARLEVLYLKLIEVVLATKYLQVDETRIEVLDQEIEDKILKRRKKKGKTHRGYYWGYLAVQEQLLFFEYDKSRGANQPMGRLDSFEGTLQTDAYEVYDKVCAIYSAICHYYCLNHARRNFEQALSNDKQRAEYALTVFQKLYAIERVAKTSNYSEEQLLQIRQQQAQPILKDFFIWMEEQQYQVLPKSPIGKAIAYLLNRKEGMQHYLSDARLHIDTNPIENAIRPIAIGRKNYLFAGSHKAAQRAAMFYSFFACCKMQNIDPSEWLLDVMQRINEHPVNQIETLLPHLWTKKNTSTPSTTDIE